MAISVTKDTHFLESPVYNSNNRSSDYLPSVMRPTRAIGKSYINIRNDFYRQCPEDEGR